MCVSFCHIHSNAVPLCFLVGVAPRWITRYVLSPLGSLEDNAAEEQSAALHCAHRTGTNFYCTVAIGKVSQHCAGHKPIANSKIILFLTKNRLH